MLRELHQELGIQADYGQATGQPEYEEASELVDVGPNLVGRMQQLTPGAAKCWQDMVAAAAGDEILLLIVSGFRSFEYQAGLIRNKIAAGQQIGDILASTRRQDSASITRAWPWISPRRVRDR